MLNFPYFLNTILAQFLEWSGALLDHLLALFSLAVMETKELFAKILTCLFLFVATLFFLLIAYLSLLAALVALIVAQCHLSWPIVLGSAALLHFGIAALLIFLLRSHHSYSPLAMTRFEIQRDVESLTRKNIPQ